MPTITKLLVQTTLSCDTYNFCYNEWQIITKCLPMKCYPSLTVISQCIRGTDDD